MKGLGFSRAARATQNQRGLSPGGWMCPEQSKEETKCLKRLKARRPRRAHQRKQLQPEDQVPEDRVPEDRDPVEAVDRVVLVDQAVAASFSAARRSVSSAPRRSTPFPTGMFVCYKGLWRNAARLCRAGSLAFAPHTSAGSPAPSSRLGISPCCLSQQGTNLLARSRVRPRLLPMAH